jgi:hydroxymethylglutaryl-CoA lyase
MNAFGCAYEGPIPVSRVMRLVRSFLKRGPAEICLADSSGLANPLQVEDVVARARDEAGQAELSLHLHNTRGLGPANVFSALRQGVTIFDTSLGGLGGCPFIPGARGNIATEDTVYLLHEMGLKTGVDLDGLVRAGLPLEAFLGKTFQTVASVLKRPPC